MERTFPADAADAADAAEQAGAAASEGVEGNGRLTATTAIVLLVLLAAEGATLVGIHALLRPHVFLGFALIPPIVLKIFSTVYRFARYYGGSGAYRRKGPPHIVLRLLGPVVIVLTVILLASGVALGYTRGSTANTVLFLHKASFVLWFGAMTIHVLGHIAETARTGPRDWTRSRPVRGGSLRRWSLVVSVAAGVLLGVWGLGQFGSWFGPLAVKLSH